MLLIHIIISFHFRLAFCLFILKVNSLCLCKTGRLSHHPQGKIFSLGWFFSCEVHMGCDVSDCTQAETSFGSAQIWLVLVLKMHLVESTIFRKSHVSIMGSQIFCTLKCGSLPSCFWLQLFQICNSASQDLHLWNLQHGHLIYCGTGMVGWAIISLGGNGFFQVLFETITSFLTIGFSFQVRS